jgi:hypothetical protein
VLSNFCCCQRRSQSSRCFRTLVMGLHGRRGQERGKKATALAKTQRPSPFSAGACSSPAARVGRTATLEQDPRPGPTAGGCPRAGRRRGASRVSWSVLLSHLIVNASLTMCSCLPWPVASVSVY